MVQENKENFKSASEEYACNLYCSALKPLNDTGCCDGCQNVKDAFIAGTKKMKEQGVTFHVSKDTPVDKVLSDIKAHLLSFYRSNDDKLAIQIRQE